MPFASVEGATAIRSEPRAFVAAFARRIAAGLLRGARPRRSNYVVIREDGDRLAFRAADWWTAINVGLNDVELAASDGRVRYAVRYPRWAVFVVALSYVLGIALIGLFLLFDLRTYLTRPPTSMVRGLSLDQNVAIAWAMALFWGFAWPWILIAWHKGPLRRLIQGLIAEVDAEAAAEARRG